MKNLPISLVSAINPAAGFLLQWQAMVKTKVKPIVDGTDELSTAANRSKTEEGMLPRTIFHSLRDSNLPTEEKTLERLCDEGETVVAAGSETTAQTLVRLLFYLKHAPHTYRKLVEELDEAVPASEKLPPWKYLQRLPYLVSACLSGVPWDSMLT